VPSGGIAGTPARLCYFVRMESAPDTPARIYACLECDSMWAVEAPRCPMCNSVELTEVEPPAPPIAPLRPLQRPTIRLVGFSPIDPTAA